MCFHFWIFDHGLGFRKLELEYSLECALPAVLCAVYNSLDDEPYNVLKIPPYGCHDIFCPGKYADARGG